MSIFAIQNIAQNDKRLNPDVRATGCFFMCHLFVGKRFWTINEIEEIRKKAIDAGAMNEKCSVSNPQTLLNLINRNIRQVGSRNFLPDGSIDMRPNQEPWGMQYPDPRIDYVILRYSQVNKEGKETDNLHFVVAAARKDKNDNWVIAYDPWCDVDGSLNTGRITREIFYEQRH
jgi:Protein of unknown function, DUF261